MFRNAPPWPPNQVERDQPLRHSTRLNRIWWEVRPFLAEQQPNSKPFTFQFPIDAIGVRLIDNNSCVLNMCWVYRFHQMCGTHFTLWCAHKPDGMAWRIWLANVHHSWKHKHIYVYIHTYTSTYTYTHIYIYTYIHTYTNRPHISYIHVYISIISRTRTSPWHKIAGLSLVWPPPNWKLPRRPWTKPWISRVLDMFISVV